MRKGHVCWGFMGGLLTLLTINLGIHLFKKLCCETTTIHCFSPELLQLKVQLSVLLKMDGAESMFGADL
jgi:hypothetical protein